MAIVSYNSHNITIIYNTKCAQTTLYSIFGQPWAPQDTDFFKSPDGAHELSKLDIFLQRYPLNYNVCFVRNSWSRMVSFWCFTKEQNKKIRIPEFNDWCENQWKERNADWPHFSRLIPLSYFVGNDFDKINFIGYQETLNQDVKFIADKYNIPFKTPEIKNASEHGPWQELFTERSKQMVYDMYRTDIEMFDFKF